ncbi:HIRAN domain-containing protein [Mesobacillus subterraneus]|uniref:HIRAN domain-containing protein n=1 Tax=Mesobacillus subterraneus TaxID=285983 RepID=UPI001CFE0A15|nr:HIRAN domain-containing protein [Mesobacillus subterraneus]WLR55428.1 HIRAN domain-containing protein [Mesobacillus subterraneus]
MFTLLVIIVIIWFISSAGGSSGSSSSSNSNNNSYSSSSYNSNGNTGRTSSTSTSKYAKEYKCTKCQHIHYSQQSHCEKCGWEISKKHIHFSANLTGVTYEGRQGIIAQTEEWDQITLKRDKNNQHDRNAVGVYNSNGRSLGWVPKGYASNIAPQMDKGITLYAEIKKIVGGNGYNYGIEVRISNDLSKMKKENSSSMPKTTPSKPVAQPSYNSMNQRNHKGNGAVATAIKIPAAVNIKNHESVYLDSILLRQSNAESRDEVLMVVTDFEKYKKAALPYMNRQRITDLLVNDLEGVFDNTIMLAGGRESNFVHRHYKAILIQLAYQLGFLIDRILPETAHARYAQNKMNWLSTMDVRLETKLLQGFFNKHVIVNGESPIIYDSTQGSQVRLWDIDEITYVLSNVTELGQKFKRYIEMN